MRVLCPPSSPVFPDSSGDIEDFGERALYVSFKFQILLPGMESPHCYLLFRPDPDMFYDLIQNDYIFFIPFGEILLNFIWIIALAHEAISDLINLVVAIAGDLVSDGFDIDLVPVLLLVDISKGRFEGVEFESFEDSWQIVKARDQLGVPFHEDFLSNS